MILRQSTSTVAWGIFCASSWTWCIGMFLPFVMINRYGWPGFIAFAVPNVIGCTAFGYVLRSRDQSQAVVRQHRGAMVGFSIVTVAFHIYFLNHIVLRYLRSVQPNDLPPSDRWFLYGTIGAIGSLAIAWALSALKDRAWLMLAALVWIGGIVTVSWIGLAPIREIPWTGHEAASELIWLAPILVFGFLLCPYLDLTFHRALQRSPGRHAFAIFGLTFAIMLVVTCVIWIGPAEALQIGLAHLFGQSIVTMSLHLRELREVSSTHDTRGVRSLVVALLLGCAAIALLWLEADSTPQAGEAWYIRFLVFYGLVFPAYVFVFMPSTGRLRQTKTNLIGVLAAIVVLAPFYELGFIQTTTKWLLVPIVVILAWGIFLRRGGTKTPAEMLHGRTG